MWASDKPRFYHSIDYSQHQIWPRTEYFTIKSNRIVRYYPAKLHGFLRLNIKFGLTVSRLFRDQISRSEDFKISPSHGVSKIGSSGIFRQSYGYFAKPIRNSDSRGIRNRLNLEEFRLLPGKAIVILEMGIGYYSPRAVCTTKLFHNKISLL
ncbi:hypothetical protein TNCV_4377751 [Trichonephila clavipes]|nr:hypothetical protein TNCV_4377751 [Trichonephila clavipes]